MASDFSLQTFLQRFRLLPAVLLAQKLLEDKDWCIKENATLTMMTGDQRKCYFNYDDR